MSRYRWTWQDWALLAIEKVAVYGVPVLLAAICWRACVQL